MHLFVHGITAFQMSLGLAYKRSMAQRMEKIQGLPRPVQDSGHWNWTHNLHLPTTLRVSTLCQAPCHALGCGEK